MNPLDPQIIAAILAAGGLGVVGFTDLLKRLLKWADGKVYLLSLIVSAGCTAFILLTTSTFTLPAFILYTIAVFFESNGLYKAVKKPNPD